MIPFSFLFLLAVSLAGNVYLAQQFLVSHSKKSQPKHLSQGPVGQHLETLHLKTVAGDATSVSLSKSRATVVYIFSPKCHWCLLNFANLKTLQSKANGKYDFLGISVSSEDLDKYMNVHPYGFPVYTDATENDFRTIGFVGTPQTLLVNNGGVIEKNWIGAYQGAVGESIEQTFSVQLPGVATQSGFTSSNAMTEGSPK